MSIRSSTGALPEVHTDIFHEERSDAATPGPMPGSFVEPKMMARRLTRPDTLLYHEYMKRHLKPLRISLAAVFLSLIVLVIARNLYQDSSPEPRDVVAMVNQQPVTYRDVDGLFRHLLLQKEFQTGAKPAAGSPEYDRLRIMALEQSVSRLLLLKEAINMNLSVSREQVNNRIAQMRQFFPSLPAFAAALEDRGITLDDVKDIIETELLTHMVLEHKAPQPAIPTEEEIIEFFEKNPISFQKEKTVDALIILSRKREGTTDEASRAKLNTVLEKLAAGADFSALASIYSDDHSAARGGRIGPVSPGKMMPEFDEVAFEMNPGEVSDIVESDAGFFIVKVLNHRAGGPLSLAEARPAIKTHLLEKRRNTAMQKYIKQLREKAEVEISPDFEYPAKKTKEQ